MRTTRGYPVGEDDRFSLDLPYGASVLCVQVNNGLPYIWVDYNVNETRIVSRNFLVQYHGRDIPDGITRYIGTWSESGFVFHLFEVVSPNVVQNETDN